MNAGLIMKLPKIIGQFIIDSKVNIPMPGIYEITLPEINYLFNVIKIIKKKRKESSVVSKYNFTFFVVYHNFIDEKANFIS